MALSAAVAFQSFTSTNGDSYVSGSQTPTNAALYVIFTIGRTGDVAHRVPTVTGTNGWNTTWTRVSAAQAIYNFAAVNRSGTEVFWGVASSGTAGTLTQDYGAGTDLNAMSFHVIRIDGGPDTTAPTGVTGSNHDDAGSASSISATLTGTPTSTSIVVACSAFDTSGTTPTAGSSYTLIGSTQSPDTGCSAIEYDLTPLAAAAAMSWSTVDILSISAVEIEIAATAPVIPNFDYSVFPKEKLRIPRGKVVT